jgi:hypothetical protein
MPAAPNGFLIDLRNDLHPAAITEVGIELDQKLAKLMDVLGLEVPKALAGDGGFPMRA